jgi:carboxylesterase type B
MPSGAALGEQRLIQHELPIGDFSQSDIDCLTLNISVPTEKHAIDLPVFVYIHGGAFFLGSSSFPQNDLYRLVQLSVDCGKPIIAVGVK